MSRCQKSQGPQPTGYVFFVSSNWHPQLGTSKLFEVFALSLPTERLMSVRTKKLSSSWHQSLFLLQLGISVVATFASPIIFFFRI
jgi:hypothetical protein